ncbi:MAG: hypothetical protein MJ033_02660 [Victivallaceae bacterium]|nr:hypothetical protein [Victivallaceae bacterium]
MPGDLPAEKIVVKGNDLYAASQGKVFRRKLRVGELVPSQVPQAPCTPGYSDGFGYPRSHLIK